LYSNKKALKSLYFLQKTNVINSQAIKTILINNKLLINNKKNRDELLKIEVILILKFLKVETILTFY